MLKFLSDFLVEESMWYFTEELCENIDCPDEKLSKYIKKLHLIIKKQREILKRFCQRIKEYQNTLTVDDASTPTDSWKEESTSIVDMVKEVAEDAMKQTGFVYDATSGLYYDYSSGYYYNSELKLYYNGNTGTYYSFDKENNQFLFHSQVALPQLESTETSTDAAAVDVPKRRKDRKSTKSKTHKRVKKRNHHEDDIEEGECSDESSQASEISSDESVQNDGSKKICVYSKEPDMDESCLAWPPCMRIIVKETTVKNLKTGNLFIVTCAGGTLGREGDHAIIIPDINISKYHAKFAFDNVDEKSKLGSYTLTDLGSRNGTFVDGKRLSNALQESDPCTISHDTTVRVGGTTLLCHVHTGRETCLDCEPGLLISNEEEKQLAYVPQENLTQKRKKQLKKLKQKFGLNNSECVSTTSKDYRDRAELRRKTVGSSSDNFKTEVASVTEPIKKTNKGFKMLSKMGWSEGEALGSKSEEAIKEPILVEQRADKIGLGYDGPSEADLPEVVKKKRELWKKVQDRYKNLE